MTLACDCAPQCLLDPSSRNKGLRCCLSLLVELGAARRQNRSRRYLKSQQAPGRPVKHVSQQGTAASRSENQEEA